MVTRGGGVGRRGKQGALSRRRAAPIAVESEERWHLVEACAFFRADHFRPAAPGSCREQDLKEVAAEIDAVLKRRAGKGGKR